MNIRTFCEYTYSFTYIPTYIYIHQQLTDSIHSYSAKIEPPEMILSQILVGRDAISIYETSIGSYYGHIFLNSRNISIILGPVSPLQYTANNIRKFIYSYHIPAAEHEDYQLYLPLIPTHSLLSFISLLYQMSYAITSTKSDLPQEELMPYRLHEMPLSREIAFHQKDKLEEGYHNTLFEIQRLTMPLIKNGDIEGLIRFSKNGIPMNYGHFSQNLRDQQLTVLIISVSNAMSAAIQGGLDQQAALSLAELYIRKGLMMTSPTDIDTLSMNAIVNFTTRVREQKYNPESSIRPTIYDCIQYIRERIYTPITVAEIATFSGYSLEHFSRLFKKESGFNANTFIINCKLYESEKLLKFTNMTIGEISTQLYFSNQSHFQKLFKQKFEMTPLQFRNSNTPI